MTPAQLSEIKKRQKYLMNFKTSYGTEDLQLISRDVPDLLAHIDELTGKVEELEAKKAALKQIMSDPENQPNQFCPSNGCLMVKDLKPMAELAKIELLIRDAQQPLNPNLPDQLLEYQIKHRAKPIEEIISRLAYGYDQYDSIVAIVANYEEFIKDDSSISDLVRRIAEERSDFHEKLKVAERNFKISSKKEELRNQQISDLLGQVNTVIDQRDEAHLSERNAIPLMRLQVKKEQSKAGTET